ncbi:MAG TPA: DUF3987 domain-containing protein [Flavisolibacter sp.]|jgi:hypothetical protein|nr:DUF3987 domain-containing protein [Flavisolibacter sp.]
MKRFSVFKDFTKPLGDVTLEEIAQFTSDGSYKEHVNKIRELVAAGELEDAGELKIKLLGFTSAGLFDSRNKDGITDYSQVIVLDKDDVADYDSAFKAITQISYTLCAFRSPSGNGIKVLVQTNGNVEDHVATFNAVAKYYEEAIGLRVDPSGKDLARLCFFSYDPSIYYNPEAQVFEVEKSSVPSQETQQKPDVNPFQQLIDACISYSNQRDTYVQGNRNNYIFKLACRCNKFGIPQETLEAALVEQFDLDEDEMITTIRSAYNKNEEHGTMPYFFRHNLLNQRNNLGDTPYLPQEIFTDLPQILKRATEVIPNPRERDMLFLGILGVFSGSLNNFKGVYDGRSVYPNLYIFNIAPPASGKGILVQAKALGQAYHNQIVEASKNARAEYERQLLEFKSNGPLEGNAEAELPIEPFDKVFYIPGNSSAAAFIERMVNSDQKVMLFETEADTISTSLKQDWGSYSEILRGGFHHEWVGINRKGRGGLFEMDSPRLAIVISGTPSQLPVLVKSIEDGLFSRFMYYIFEEAINWRDVSPSKQVGNRDEYFANLGRKALEIIKFHDENKTDFHFTQNQWQQHNDYFSMVTEFYGHIYGNDAYSQSIINRMGLIRYRIAMILSALRQFDSESHEANYICTDLDFNISKKIVEVMLYHSFVVMSRLPKKSNNDANPMLTKFLSVLPSEFTRAEAVKAGESIKVKPRTVDLHLKTLVETGKLSKEGSGMYKKK